MSEAYEGVFNSRYASKLARQYRRRGLTQAASRIVEFVSTEGIQGASVLEIGGGIGEIQLELLEGGAAKTTNLELSGAYESEAKRLIIEAGFEGQVHRRQDNRPCCNRTRAGPLRYRGAASGRVLLLRLRSTHECRGYACTQHDSIELSAGQLVDSSRP